MLEARETPSPARRATPPEAIGDGAAPVGHSVRSTGRPWSPASVGLQTETIFAGVVVLASASGGLVFWFGPPLVAFSLLSCGLLLLLLWKNERSDAGVSLRIRRDRVRRVSARRRKALRTRRLRLLEWAVLFALLAANLIGSALAFT